MFSYLSAIQSEVDDAVYKRGLKYYLEGKIVKYNDLILDYWREYEISGEYDYYVKVPLLHLALDRSKYDKAGLAILQSASCNCPFYQESSEWGEYRICKHIVAVCASLDKEFNLEIEIRKQKINKIQSQSLLSNIFEAEKTRKIREFENSLDIYEQSSKIFDFRWWEGFVVMVNDEYEEYADYLISLKNALKLWHKDYDKEKKLIPLITKSLLFGNPSSNKSPKISLDSRLTVKELLSDKIAKSHIPIFWEFWKDSFSLFEAQNWEKLWLEIWEMRALNLLKDLESYIDSYVFELDNSLKLAFFEKLKETFPDKQNIWLLFALQGGMWDWFLENIQELDPQTLLSAGQKWPEHQEEIEPVLAQKMRIWIDFMQKGDYEDLIETFKKWFEVFAGGENYSLTLDYLKQIHGKKRSLIAQIPK